MIELTVIGTPAPQGSKVRTRFGVREDNPNTAPWRSTVAAKAAEALDGRPLLDGPLSITARFYFARPKAHFKKSGELREQAPRWHTGRPDADKLARAVGDALSGVAIRDDARVALWRIEKLYGEPARAELTVERIGWLG